MIAPSLDYLERAYDPAKYARVSEQPYLEAHCDPRHRVEVHAQYVPYGAAPAALALDQALWMRPLPELAHYRTPIEGLWLCGAAMHPGGGIAGAAGYNCARAALASR